MKKSNRKRLHRALFFVICMLIGAAVGYFAAAYGPMRSGGKLLQLGAGLLLFWAAMMLQILLHEGGHLVFGLMSGYGFCSFRVGNRMLLRKNGRFCIKKLSIAGTGGQCLMTPPDYAGGSFPFLAYNLGGAIMNFITAALFLLLWDVLPPVPLLSPLLLMLALAGVAAALLNGIPMHTASVDNDGFNALSLRKSPAARRAFWLQMHVNALTTQGVRLRDMPPELFEVPADEALDSALTTASAVLAANYLTDCHRFDEAEALVEHLLESGFPMAGIHRSLLICERICWELTHENRPAVLEALLDKPQLQFMKSMKQFPTVLRTEYLLALLRDGDRTGADAIRRQFEKIAASYPYPTDIESERELMELAG